MKTSTTPQTLPDEIPHVPPNAASQRSMPQSGMPSISSMAPSLPTVMMTSPSVLVRKPASQYAK